jgi:hypothetical protein
MTMNNVRDWTPNLADPYECVMLIEEWEECVRDELFTDYDGFGYFCDPEKKEELFGFDVCPSMVGTPTYEQRRVNWTHINWFNR